jgi:hypothetical protein
MLMPCDTARYHQAHPPFSAGSSLPHPRTFHIRRSLERLDPRTAVQRADALAYVLGPISAAVFLMMEKQSRFVRFHAMQSRLVSAVLLILTSR